MEMPRTIIVNEPKRSGKWWTRGANCTESCLANNKGVLISTPSPNIQKITLIGRGTNIDANHIPAAIENPMEYLVVSWRAAGTNLLVRKYSTTRIVRIIA